ncbi:MAG TPA: hypothetical protein VGB77_19520 [Abditibacteriaceae bacterium]|jgi:hypothetical protein
MAIVDTFGKCSCGEFNAMTAMKCHSCGERLPWVSPHALGAARGQVAQSSYWSAALSGQGTPVGGVASGGASGAAAGSASYNNDPDINFTPLGGGNVGNSGGSGLGSASFYCSHCGSGLKAGQHICHSCRHLTTFTRADLRFTIMISSLLVSGFLLGVVWTAVVINAANTGEWRLPGVKFNKTETTSAQKPAAKPSRSKSPVDEYGVPKR